MARRTPGVMELMHPGSLLMLGIRVVQFILAIAALGVTGSLVSAVKSYFQFLEFDDDYGYSHSCSVPGRFDYNIFCGVITILALIYLAVSAKLLFHIPMVKYSHLAIDACLFIFWLIAAATASTVFLEDLCGICGYRYYLDFFDDYSGAYDFTCCCVNFDSCCDSQYVFWKRQLLGQRSNGKSTNTKNTHSSTANAGKRAGSADSKWAARKGLDAVLCVLFFITLVAVAYFIWSGSRARGTATTTPRTDTKVTDPTKDGIGMEHQAQPVSAPAPQYIAQQPDYGIQHDQTGFQQKEAHFDHTQDPYQAMQPGFGPHHPTHGQPGHQDNTYAGV